MHHLEDTAWKDPPTCKATTKATSFETVMVQHYTWRLQKLITSGYKYTYQYFWTRDRLKHYKKLLQ